MKRTLKEISKELGMRPEEIFRLTDISKEEFLRLMASRAPGYSKELYLRKV